MKKQLKENMFEATERDITLTNINQHQEAIEKIKEQKKIRELVIERVKQMNKNWRLCLG